MNEKLSSSNEYAQSKPTLHQQQISRYATHLYTISYLIIFSILGTLARLSLQWLTFYPGAPITFAELWANVAGTLLMGFLAEDSRFFRLEWGNQGPTSTIAALDDEETAPEEVAAAKAIHSRAKKTIPLYIGLATGFCGSFTSFSSFMRDVFFALSNDLPSPINHPYPPPDLPNTSSTISRNGGHSFMAVCAILLVTMALCYSALKAGAHIANFLDPYTPTLPFRATRRFLDPLIVFVAWGAWIGAVIMAIWPPDRPGGSESKGDRVNETWRGHVLFACVFAPVGCLLRFYASLYLNHFVASFPLGTFAVNIFGTAVLGMAFDLQHVSIGTSGVGGGRVGCQVLQGVMDGFCGSLTTISTWILEIHGLRKAHGYFYSLSSIGVGLGTLVAIMGSVRWTVGWSAPVCGV
ncbi:CrcB-like protein [Massariosphaeria phaeospora]|uniref:CrcB-like protein n=1 Tax=Massariosphaeria phaeospora TaxID=100035 RepID=A0A7C8ICF1_9PLEO|nr:CrcB-like protein [Massariosphaeria phaeospora]